MSERRRRGEGLLFHGAEQRFSYFYFLPTYPTFESPWASQWHHLYTRTHTHGCARGSSEVLTSPQELCSDTTARFSAWRETSARLITARSSESQDLCLTGAGFLKLDQSVWLSCTADGLLQSNALPPTAAYHVSSYHNALRCRPVLNPRSHTNKDCWR